MSETVQRYDIEECSGNPYESYRDMVRAPDGDWVYYVDYADLAQQLAAARAENERMREALAHYANAVNWMSHTDADAVLRVWIGSGDGPDYARRALAAQEGSNAD